MINLGLLQRAIHIYLQGFKCGGQMPHAKLRRNVLQGCNFEKTNFVCSQILW